MLVTLPLLVHAGLPPMDPPLRIAAMLFAACPSLGIYPILARRQGRDGLAAAVPLGTTIVSFVTISALLRAFKQIPGWGRLTGTGSRFSRSTIAVWFPPDSR